MPGATAGSQPQTFSGPMAPQDYSMNYSDDYPVKPGAYETAQLGVRPRGFFLVAGGFILTMLLMIPFWNAIALMNDQVLVFFAGDSIPMALIIACASVLVLYGIGVSLFFSAARVEAQNEHSVMMIIGIFLTLLGVCMMLVSFPLRDQAQDAYQEVWSNCGYGAKSSSLLSEYNTLAELRAQPACAMESSVQDCAGYQSNDEAKVLRYMESHYKCSGFCVQASTLDVPPVNTTAGVTPQSSLLQTRAETLQKKMQKQELKETRTSGSKQKIHQVPGETPVASDSNVLLQYPPTLFSQANYKASCDGMAARNMKTFVEDVGYQTYYQGVALVFVAIGIQLLKLLGFCCGRGGSAMYKVPEYSNYGT